VRLLREKLKPITPVSGETLKKLIDALDSPRFAEREAAEKALTELGEAALAELRSRLENKPSVEQKSRIEKILKPHEKPGTLPPAVLRQARAVMILERIGNADARKLLQELSGGAPEAAPTREAIRAMERLRFSRAE
jgi:HEAT repeat protein